jgi:multicomponent Na+:H+ antiporter subunit B
VVDAEGSTPLRVLGWAMVGISLLLGLWLVSFGLITPGGGFQGGVVLAGAIVLVYAALSYRTWHKVSNEHLVEPFEGFGVGAYVAIGLAAVVIGLPFLHNLLPNGTTGTLLSGGSMPLLNWATAIEVAAANVVLFSEFLLRHVVGRKRA